jgi:hypothetical protein
MNDNCQYFVELMRRKAPEYLDLLTADEDTDFEKSFDVIMEKAVSGLEANSKSFSTLDEVGLSGALALAINMPGLTVLQEGHSNGHVDLTVVADHCYPARKKLGEAKIWGGSRYHMEGLGQLLNRYTTGREGRGFLIAYVKQKNIKGLIEKLRERMDVDRPCKQKGQTMNHTLRWSFLSVHAHTCGEELQVGHIGCNLYAA